MENSRRHSHTSHRTERKTVCRHVRLRLSQISARPPSQARPHPLFHPSPHTPLSCRHTAHGITHTHSLSTNKTKTPHSSGQHITHSTQPKPCTTRERAAAASSSPSSHTHQRQPAPGLQGTPLSSPSSFVLSGLFLQRPLVSPERPLTLFFFRQLLMMAFSSDQALRFRLLDRLRTRHGLIILDATQHLERQNLLPRRVAPAERLHLRCRR